MGFPPEAGSLLRSLYNVKKNKKADSKLFLRWSDGKAVTRDQCDPNT